MSAGDSSLLPSATMPGMRIEYALLADYADLAGGKLYLMGGGWDTYHAAQAPFQLRIAVALGVRVGWEETNQPVPVRVVIEDDDGNEIVRMDGTLNVGRPPHLPPGTAQLAQMAANLPANIPAFGGYRVRATAGEGDGSDQVTIAFRALQRP